ncbi:MAG: ABC transporter ATP-binding protein [Ruminococcaceae bacterium]|nr:ABC transporter ATP-binding protein [Oscillospiraceae bacterium]
MQKIRTYIRMLRLVVRYEPKRLWIMTGAYMFSRTFGQFYALFFMRHIINQLEARGPLWELLVFIGLFGLWDFVGLVIRAWTDRYYEPISDQRLDHALNELIMDKLRRSDLAQYETPAFYDQLRIVTAEFKPRFRELIYSTAEFWTSIYMFCIALTVLIAIDPILLVFSVPVLAATWFEKKRTEKEVERKKAAAPANRRADYVRRTMSERRTVGDLRLTNVYTVMQDIFHTSIAELRSNIREYGVKVGLWHFAQNVCSWILPHIGMHLGMAWRMMSTDRYTLGDFSTVSNAIYSVTGGIEDAFVCANKLLEISAYGEDFFKFLEGKSSLRTGDRKPSFEQALTVENLTFSYPGSDVPVLDGVSFTLKKGETVAVVGYNGAGKSTLVKLLLHLYEPQAGSIRVDGMDIRDCGQEAYRALFGCCFQDGQIYALSIRENVLTGSDGDLDRALERAEAGEVVRKNAPHGVESVMTREFDPEGVVLSGGERQKLLAARACANDAPIMIFDEPTANLDPLAEYAFFESLVRISNDKTLVFISHRLSAAQLADRILFMEHGRVAESGTHAELMKLGGKYADMYLKQASSYIEKGVGA